MGFGGERERNLIRSGINLNRSGRNLIRSERNLIRNGRNLIKSERNLIRNGRNLIRNGRNLNRSGRNLNRTGWDLNKIDIWEFKKNKMRIKKNVYNSNVRCRGCCKKTNKIINWWECKIKTFMENIGPQTRQQNLSKTWNKNRFRVR